VKVRTLKAAILGRLPASPTFSPFYPLTFSCMQDAPPVNSRLDPLDFNQSKRPYGFTSRMKTSVM